jgi:tetratricopeptide (TPR) repeat protein
MLSKPSRSPTIRGPASSLAPAASSPMRATAGTLWRGRSWWGLAIACGVIALGVMAAVVWTERHPGDLAEADAAYRRNELAKAFRLADAHLTRRPSSRVASLLAARCLSRLGRPDRAEEFYQRALPLDVEDLHLRAYALVLANRRDRAIGAYREILERRPRDVLASSRLAAVLISESRWEETLELAHRLIEIPDGAVIGHTLAGVVHHNTKDAELAVFAFDRVLVLDPGLQLMPLKPRSMFWTEFAHNLLVVGRWADARRCLERALSDGEDARVADLLGQSYYLEGALDDAERYWRQALQWDPDRYGTWWRIGKLELQRGRPAEAVESLRRASSIQPNALGPLYSLSLAYRRLGRKLEADRCMKRAEVIRRKPEEPSRGIGDRSPLDSEDFVR